jgi:hypothetical protein
MGLPHAQVGLHLAFPGPLPAISTRLVLANTCRGPHIPCTVVAATPHVTHKKNTTPRMAKAQLAHHSPSPSRHPLTLEEVSRSHLPSPA